MERCGNVSFFNFLGLEDSGYGDYAKGILYVICEILGKIIQAACKLIDVITGLFYKLAGANYLGSGSETLVEEQDLLSKLFNQNIVSNVSLFMILVSFLLMSVFGVSAIIKQLYFSKDERKSMGDVIKNMVLAFIFLIALAPLAMFAISAISTITSALVNAFGDASNVSLADLLFNASFSGNAVETYNALYETEITSWTEMENNFLFDIAYGGTESNLTFYWYVFLLGGGVILFNLVLMTYNLIKRIFNVIVLYITAPVYVARMVDDGGSKFKEWKNRALSELVSIVGTTIAFMVLISLIGVINDIELVSVVVDSGIEESFGEITEEVQINETALLLNNIAKIFLVMAGTAVAKDSGELLGNVFKSTADDNSLLEGIFNRLGSKETHVTDKGGSSSPKTRVITRTTTSSKKIMTFNETLPSMDYGGSSRGSSRDVNVVNNHRNTFNTNVNKVDRRISNIQNRATISAGGVSGSERGQYRDSESKPTDILRQPFEAYKQENDKMRNEWDFVKNGNSQSSVEVVKEFEGASKELDSAIANGEPSKIKGSMNKYVEAFKNEEKVVKAEYRDFAGRSSKITGDLSTKQQDELRKISTAYRKAQVDYSKTAQKLSQVSSGNMSASEALKVKERADKQREKLMEASSKANDFYNNQKKGV